MRIRFAAVFFLATQWTSCIRASWMCGFSLFTVLNVVLRVRKEITNWWAGGERQDEWNRTKSQRFSSEQCTSNRPRAHNGRNKKHKSLDRPGAENVMSNITRLAARDEARQSVKLLNASNEFVRIPWKFTSHLIDECLALCTQISIAIIYSSNL